VFHNPINEEIPVNWTCRTAGAVALGLLAVATLSARPHEGRKGRDGGLVPGRRKGPLEHQILHGRNLISQVKLNGAPDGTQLIHDHENSGHRIFAQVRNRKIANILVKNQRGALVPVRKIVRRRNRSGRGLYGGGYVCYCFRDPRRGWVWLYFPTAAVTQGEANPPTPPAPPTPGDAGGDPPAPPANKT
jgi:hypothetical protein